ncbi:MAG: DUF3598 family protein, partial [Leptolyngbyaceae bacterium]|nr:DUF3598 family protein [Leptolyngbyaceae bacterium]
MSQWTHLLENLGIWDGQFQYFSSQGIEIESTPSRVSLEGLENHQRIRQVVQMLSTDRQTVVSERVLDYRTLNRSVLVFPSGAFSQGSMQYGPFSEFGAELGFISGDRRCRLVQLFDKESNFSKLTLIPEYRQGTDTEDIHRLNARPFRVEDWLGEWHGTAMTLYADLSPATEGSVKAHLSREGDRLIEDSHQQGHSTHRQWR